MTLFTPDLYRNFWLGFGVGALMVGAATIGDWAPHLASPAYASELPEAPYVSGKFEIKPILPSV